MSGRAVSVWTCRERVGASVSGRAVSGRWRLRDGIQPWCYPERTNGDICGRVRKVAHFPIFMNLKLLFCEIFDCKE